MKIRNMPKPAYRLFPGLILILAPFVLLSPLLLTGQALFWGTPALQFMPWREFAVETLKAGGLPLWNPWLGMGAPLFANYQTALAYPPTWSQMIISWLAGIEASAWWQGVLVVLHWSIATLGMVRLARGLGLGNLAQAVSGLAFGVGGYLVSRAGFLSINAVAAWMPWIVHYAGQVSSSKLRRGVPLARPLVRLSIVSGLQLLAGHAQIAWYTFLLAGLWSGYWGWVDADLVATRMGRQASARLKITSLMKGWMWLAAGYAVGVGIAAVQLLPTVEYLTQSQRAGEVDYQYAMTYSFWPWRFLSLLAPDLFGSPVRGDYWGYGNYWEDSLYIGVLPLLLAAAALLGWLARRPSVRQPDARQGGIAAQAPLRLQAIPFLAALVMLSFTLALGNNTVIFPWLYRNIPTFDMFQAPARFTIWAAFALALLAGFGAHVWRRPQKRALYWTRLGTAGAVAVMLGSGLTWYLMGDVSPTFIRAAALAGLWGVGAGILSLTAPVADDAVGTEADQTTAAGYKNKWQWAVAVFVAADLIAAGWGLNPGIDPEFYSSEPQTASLVREMLLGRRLYLSLTDEEELKYRRFLRFDSFDAGEDWHLMRAVLLPNMALFDSIASLNNFDPLLPGRYSRWMATLAAAQGGMLDKLLDLSGVGVMETSNPAAPTGVNFQQMPEELGSRARWVPCALSAQDAEQALELVVRGSFDPNIDVILEGYRDQTGTGCSGTVAAGVVELESEGPGGLVFRVLSDQPGWLLLSDTWYPGWQATVDRRTAPIFRANYLFRAVQIPAGDRLVRFIYRPLSFYLGLILSLIALLVLAGISMKGTRFPGIPKSGE